MTLLRRALAPLLLLGLALAPAVPAGPGPAPWPSAPRRPEGPHACRGKPTPPIGKLWVEVVERPAEDRAVLEARWTRGRSGGPERVELVLPEGAAVLEGPSRRTFAAGETSGRLRWTVVFPVGVDLDAVVRLRATGGGRPLGREASFPLGRAP